MSESKFTKKEESEFAKYELLVEEWLDKTVEAGNALWEIWRRKLYLITHPGSNFRSYIKERYGKSHVWAYDLINQVAVLAKTGWLLSKNAAKPLEGIDEDTMKEVVDKAAVKAKERKKDAPARADIEAAIAETPAAVEQKTAAARKSFTVVEPADDKPQFVGRIETGYVDAVLESLNKLAEKDDSMEVKYEDDGSISMKVGSLFTLMKTIGRYFDNLPVGSTVDFQITAKRGQPEQQGSRQQMTA